MGSQAAADIKSAWNPAWDAAQNAAHLLPPGVQEFFRAGRLAASGSPEEAALHPFRLATKRLRYSVELLAGLYPDEAAEQLAALKEVQTFLGDITDCLATRDLLLDRHERLLPPNFLSFLQQRMQSRLQLFQEYWRRQLDSAGAEERWLAYFCQPRTP